VTRWVLVAASAVTLGAAPAPGPSIAITRWGTTRTGAPVEQVTLRNAHALTMRLIGYGGIVTGIDAPDRNGRFANVVLGYGSFADYEAKNVKNRFGAVIGRYAGRIAGAAFAAGGKTWRLTPNDGPNALHGGGAPGLDSQVWAVSPIREAHAVGAVLRLTSPDGQQGFPGRLTVSVTYRLFDDDAIQIDYAATTDKPTMLNLTNHSYFNLAGAGSGSVERQLLTIAATRFVETDGGGIPTGKLPAVAGTPLDFRTPRPIGERIDTKRPPMTAKGGYNHAWFLTAGRARGPFLAAMLEDPGSGRTLRIETTEPSLTAYTGDYIDGQDADGSGHIIHPRDGIALETQHLSDSPHRPDFPTTLLKPGETFRSTTIWRFGVRGGPRR
jgi:aldose 1-epimerase